jgi:phage shock protein E
MGMLGALFGRGRIDSAEARRLVAAGAVLLDVRSPEEYAERHLPGALNIPVQALAGRTAELGAPTRPVVVYCRSGMRSARAAGLLARAGFTVHDLGGMGKW